MACLNFVRRTWQKTIDKAGHDGVVLKNMVVTQAKPGWVRTELKIGTEHINNHNTIHGGVILSMVDTVTSLALQSRGIVPPTGASVNASCEFVRPGGKVGDTIYGHGEVTQLGRTLAYTRVNFYNAQDKIVAFGSHTKFMGKNQPSVGFSPDGETEVPLEGKHGHKL
ncbi:hypothetical protein CcaverHIS002_0302320 [Cutaneotrichosporon cavernicola]|uniref:Thioesterase domain-containing protein n=1 Tax=Cutaneotrichosporon cavernicola TaxID=279322 RepID=A0AA48I989_9TREE|nr:uncharacterized protein CcaverHIS019_0302300 [Cutaneotrichosporon cavernicola]BEI82364.1 hypothetical protein CcaverHIS002_0302320 [Cutaneotrichosporon cavernicola]BEI90160.1 hypothetical protein CcaverHIS019_0302300 [Cutaneotrichosporon cavernicola]BEI97938.1 hypothetical protein CcaverHIS631_0302370 [Cutaneotrichosporon cavernicola]BEJ05717.1 hypothetical protein CcaverHIS641_0302390 [Cutaneotrichosporon cavernicola]